MYATEVHTSAVREAHVFDVERLTSFMAQQIPSFVPPLQVRPPILGGSTRIKRSSRRGVVLTFS
jgi:hypothetical protein